MRLPFPDRIPLLRVVIFCIVLCAVQQAEGTSLLFSACTFAFIVIATIAFNLTGGFSMPSGTYIFAYAVLTAILGVTYKAFVGEPAQSNLQQPERTIEVYLATIIMMLLAAYIARRLRLKKSYLPNFASNEDMRRVSIACFLLGGVETLYLMLRTSNVANGSLASASKVFAGFVTLAMVLGVLAEIRGSGGRRSVNVIVIASGLIIFVNGLIGYSKEGMLTPFICWLVPAASQRFKVSLLQIAGFAAALAFVFYYLVPYSQYGRNYHSESASLSENLKVNLILLSELDTVRKAYNLKSLELYYGSTYSHYYNNPQGLFDRLQMMTPDDLVITYTENVQPFGFLPTIFAFENVIPHFIWRDKPSIGWGNVYAHELGLLGDEEDASTGISFSPTGDLYHQGKWVGILVVLPILLTGMFFIVDSVCGDTRLNPFALAATIGFLHAAPEAGVDGIVSPATTGMITFFILAFLLTRFMPLVAELFLGRVRAQPRRVGPAFSKPMLLQGPEAAENIAGIGIPEPMYRWSRGKQKA